jgi:hypothetical protein
LVGSVKNLESICVMLWAAKTCHVVKQNPLD